MAIKKKSRSIPAGKVNIDMREDQIVIGGKIKYRGDKVPYVTKFLRDKGEKAAGSYLLPSFDLGELNSQTRTSWADIPCPKDVEFEVIKIETGRKKKARKKKDGTIGTPASLPDLVILRSDHFKDTVIGLRKEDIVAKFDSVFIPDAYTPEELDESEIIEAIAAKEGWKENILEEGW